MFMYNCILINNGLLIAAHGEQLFSRYLISHLVITYIRLLYRIVLHSKEIVYYVHTSGACPGIRKRGAQNLKAFFF